MSSLQAKHLRYPNCSHFSVENHEQEGISRSCLTSRTRKPRPQAPENLGETESPSCWYRGRNGHPSVKGGSDHLSPACSSSHAASPRPKPALSAHALEPTSGALAEKLKHLLKQHLGSWGLLEAPLAPEGSGAQSHSAVIQKPPPIQRLIMRE